MIIPGTYPQYVADVEVDDAQVELALWDTSGSDEYDRLRPLSYLSSDVVLLCFALDDPEALGRVQSKVRIPCPSFNSRSRRQDSGSACPARFTVDQRVGSAWTWPADYSCWMQA